MSVLEDELEFDMWDGQFEFFGNSYAGVGGVGGAAGRGGKAEHELAKHGVYDKTADLIFAPVTIEEAVESVRSANKSRTMNLKKQALLGHVTDDVSCACKFGARPQKGHSGGRRLLWSWRHREMR